jgi:hypothetical protein
MARRYARATRAEYQQRVYGVRPVDGKNMEFYMAGTRGEIRKHRPGSAASIKGTIAARHPVTGELIQNGGTDRVIGRLPGAGTPRPREEPNEFQPLPAGDWDSTTGLGEAITNANEASPQTDEA